MKEVFERALEHYIAPWKKDTNLHQALYYSLMTGGKRVRPQIVLLLGEILGMQAPVMKSALCVEFFHTASLIADDLPCMDNEIYRRQKLTLHKAFDEETALLASYALITEAFGCIYQNAADLRNSSPLLRHYVGNILECALECTSRVAGIRGATLGQYLDIKNPTPTAANLKELIYLKTVTLFEGAFVLGWAFGGGPLSQLPYVKRAAHHFGMSFQILDDMQDRQQDAQSSPNIANLLGEIKTQSILQQELEALETTLSQLEISDVNCQRVVALLGRVPPLLASSSV